MPIDPANEVMAVRPFLVIRLVKLSPSAVSGPMDTRRGLRLGRLTSTRFLLRPRRFAALSVLRLLVLCWLSLRPTTPPVPSVAPSPSVAPPFSVAPSPSAPRPSTCSPALTAGICAVSSFRAAASRAALAAPSPAAPPPAPSAPSSQPTAAPATLAPSSPAPSASPSSPSASSSSPTTGSESEMMRPSASSTMRVAYWWANSGLWVTIITRRWRATSCSRSITCTDVVESNAPVGSSASTISGSLISARAMATRCICPPDSWEGRLCECSAKPTVSRAAKARRRRCPRETPESVSASSTLATTLWCGIRL